MQIKLIKHLLCVMIATVAFNAQAVFIAEVDTTRYQWVVLDETDSLDTVHIGEKVTGTATLYEYEYTSRELEKDISHSYAPWHGTSDWYSSSSLLDTASVTTNDTGENVNGNEALSVKVLLLIASGLIGVIGLTRDRSNE